MTIQELTQNEKYKFWYLKIKECKESDLSVQDFCERNNIVGDFGVIENNFHDRKDLTSNVCAVYTEGGYCCQGIAGQFLCMVQGGNGA